MKIQTKLLAATVIPLVLTGCNGSMESLTGYAASMMCSKTFVTGLDQETIYTEDLIPITDGNVELTNTRIDLSNKSVTSSILNVSNTAVYRDGFGCTLVGEDGVAALLDKTPSAYPHAHLDSQVYWPFGAAGIDPTDAVYDEALTAIVAPHFTEFKEYQVKTHSVAVVHQGRLVYEKYADDYSPDTPIYGFSVAKTVSALFAGVLYDQGLLKLDQPTGLPYWQADNSDIRNAITPRQLLNMTSGLDFDESLVDQESDANLLFVADDMAAFSADQPSKYAPGSDFYYSTGDTMVLSSLLTQLSGGSLEAVYDKLQLDLLQRLNANASIIQSDSAGNLVFGMQGLFGTQDLARLGQLLLNDGAWDGQQLVSPEWISIMSTPVPFSDDLGYTYGAGIWLNSGQHGNKFLPSLPDDTLIAFGLRGQFVIASKSLDMVIVRTGSTMDAYDFIADMDAFAAQIVNIVKN
jgi:CubicO group peptidase (beta-lactamase class C family)